MVEYRALERRPRRGSTSGGSASRAGATKHPLQYEPSETEIKPQEVIEALYEATGGDAIVTSDVGQHQMWAAQYFHFKGPRRWINSGGLGTMGYGLPAAMGAAVGRPDETVICITGDGSIQMNAQEFATCADNGIPVKTFIINNGYLGMVRQWQELFWDRRYSQVKMTQNPDFVKLAEAYGCSGHAPRTRASCSDGIREALAHDGPVVVDVPVTQEENVYPMIAPGAARARHGGLIGDGRAGNQGGPVARGARGRGLACTRAASTSSRSSWRTSRAS